MNMNSITVELMVDDMKKTLAFYVDLLGFTATLTYPETEPIFTIIENGTVKIMLYHRSEFAKEIPEFTDKQIGGTVALYIGVPNITEWMKKLKGKVELIQDMHETSYGSREFSFKDINGYVLMFHEDA